MRSKRAGADRFERLVSKYIDLYERKVERSMELLLVDGRAPGTVKVTSRQELANLLAMRDMNDPRFLQSEQAQKRLVQLMASVDLSDEE